MIRAVFLVCVAAWIIVGLVAGVAGTLRLTAAAEERCYYKGEHIDGLNKICYYTCPSGEAAATVKSHQLCPMSIKR